MYIHSRADLRRVFFYFATIPHELGHAAPKKAHDTAGPRPAPLRSESLVS